MFLSPGDRGGRQGLADGQGGYALFPWSVSGSALAIAQTWNTTATPTAIKLNVTDTASNAASLLMDLQVGGTSKLNVTKAGVMNSNGILFAGTSSSAGYIQGQFTAKLNVSLGNGVAAIYAASTNGMQIGCGGDSFLQIGNKIDSTPVLVNMYVAGNDTLQLGKADAASPVAQTLRAQSSTSTNNSGANLTIIGSKSAGSGTSGSIIFQAGVTGASSGTTNTVVTALTITPGTTNNTNVGYPSVVIGAGAAIATNATDGFLYIPTCAGAPSGTPTTQTGSAPIVIDTTNSKIMAYVGGAWKGVTIA